MKTFGRTTLGVVGALAIALLPTLVFGDDAAAAAPTPNKGDTAWMLTSTALVLLMSVPALALVLRRPRPQQEHAVGADAGVRRASR